MGFGKTEVALRAAFKMYFRFLPVRHAGADNDLHGLAALSDDHQTDGRFPVKSNCSPVSARLAATGYFKATGTRGDRHGGGGHHRLVSQRCKFRNLGLVIIDEEQRFWRGAKRKLKQLCKKRRRTPRFPPTPIPRTLNMAMSGIRDMSVIEEAPHDRHPVQILCLGA